MTISPIHLLTIMAAVLAPGMTSGGPEAERISALPVSPLGTGALMETAAGLLLIIALIIGLSWLLRRFARRPLGGQGEISVLGGVSLGPRERAVLLQVGAIRLLVGVAPGRVQTLHVLGRQEEASDFQGEFKTALGEEG